MTRVEQQEDILSVKDKENSKWRCWMYQSLVNFMQIYQKQNILKTEKKPWL